MTGLVNPLGYGAFVQVPKELWMVSFETVCHHLWRPIILFCCRVNVNPKKRMVPVHLFVVFLFGTPLPTISFLFPLQVVQA